MSVYVLHLIGGTEYKVQKALVRKGYTVCLPREMAYIRHQGKITTQERLLLPSYIFFETDLTDKIYYDITAIDGVIRFLGKPITPLSESDESYIKWLGNDGEIISPSLVTYDGNEYKALSGIIKGNEDRVVKYDKRQNKARIKINIAGTEKTINISVKFNDKVYPDNNVDALHCLKDTP